MHAVAGDRGDVHDGALPLAQRRRKAAAERQRGEEVQLEDLAPEVEAAVRQPRRSLKAVFGDTAALFTRACTGTSPIRALASVRQLTNASGSARSAVIWR